MIAFKLFMEDEKEIKNLAEIKKEHILSVLKRTKWNIKEASVILKVSDNCLKKIIKRYYPKESQRQ